MMDTIIIPKRKKTYEQNKGGLEIGCNNWQEEFPYAPKVSAELSHDNNNLYLTYNVDEEYVAATALKDNDPVFKDSCVEFFVAFDDKGYYNIEANCAGTILMSHRKGRKIDVEYASPEILSKILRKPSLGRLPFECKKAEGNWQLMLTIPASAFFKHDFKNLSGVKARCNIYKCGDELPLPHYLSMAPIKTPQPDFHQPEFFTPVEFE